MTEDKYERMAREWLERQHGKIGGPQADREVYEFAALLREVGGEWVSVSNARFWMRVSETGSCWVWTGARNKDGYGYLRDGESTVLAHRFAWASLNGPIPDGGQILHHCDNPPCCNPEHLYVGTHADNMRDMANRGRAATGKTSRYRGVSKVGRRWRATCGRDNKHVGYFDTEEEAALAYDVAALERLGASAKVNFPLPAPPDDENGG